MRMESLPNIKTQTSYSRFAGGIDVVSPPMAIDSGKCISAMNYEAGTLGGYRRIEGYERFDGRKSPSDQSYYYCQCTFFNDVSIGDTVTGITSKATGKVISKDANSIIITRVSGEFIEEDFTGKNGLAGHFIRKPLIDGCSTGFDHATALHLTANEYRTDIKPVDGNDVIRGVFMLNGVAYAMRNCTDDTEVCLYKSTSNGWQKINLFQSIPFKDGSLEVNDGIIINQKQGVDVLATAIVSGSQYTITAIGTSDFTKIGASKNELGITFTASASTTGTGTAILTATATVKRHVIEEESAPDLLQSTSTTETVINTGSKTFTVESGQNFVAGQDVNISYTKDSGYYLKGTIASYSGQSLVVNVKEISGTTTTAYSSWVITASSLNPIAQSGRFIVTDVIGVFTATDKLSVGSVVVATADGTLEQIKILSGGNYQFIQYNFKANVDAKRIYGVDSLNRAFEFDGDVYIPIRTAIAIDAPSQITAIDNQLVLSYFGQILFSAMGEPHNFRTTAKGFQHLGFGDTVVGMSPQVGGILALFCRDSCYQVYTDTSTGLYASKLISPDLGAIHYGTLNLNGVYAVDDKGIVKVVPSYVFGGFEHDTVSRQIQPIFDKFREKIVATAVFKSKNQCRFYASDGSGICMTLADARTANGGTVTEHHFTQFKYPVSVSYAWNGEDASGRDIVLFGDSNGYVYVCGKGSSFDGEEITAYIRTAFNNLKSPSAIKRFRKLEVEMSAVGYCKLRFNPDYSYADPRIATHEMKFEEVNGSGGYWDESTFNEFYYDGKIVSQPELRLNGSGINIGLVAFSQSAIDFGHTLSGAIIHYTPRKLNR